MSEIPKLKTYYYSKYYESHYTIKSFLTKKEVNIKNAEIIESFLFKDNLKEVNAFWDKYKNRPMSFLEDYPEYNEYVNDLLEYYEFLSDKYKLRFRDWLHDKLYKVE